MKTICIALGVSIICISCGKKIENADLYGKWLVIGSEYHEEQLQTKNQDSLTEYQEMVAKAARSLEENIGEHWFFNEDMTFTSDDSITDIIYWRVNDKNDEINFSDTKDPFETNYTFEEIYLRNNILLIYDYIPRAGYSMTSLKKVNQ